MPEEGGGRGAAVIFVEVGAEGRGVWVLAPLKETSFLPDKFFYC